MFESIDGLPVCSGVQAILADRTGFEDVQSLFSQRFAQLLKSSWSAMQPHESGRQLMNRKPYAPARGIMTKSQCFLEEEEEEEQGGPCTARRFCKRLKPASSSGV